MSLVGEVVEGWTGRLAWQLTLNGAAVDADAADLTLSELFLTGRDGTVVATDGDFGWLVAADGTVYYLADADDFVANKSPYRIRWKVTDADGKVVFFPNAEPDEIVVHPVR
jgi:hypothetical protein